MRLPRRTTEPFNYIFREMSNQLYRVTLNSKVKLDAALILSRVIEYLRHGLRRGLENSDVSTDQSLTLCRLFPPVMSDWLAKGGGLRWKSAGDDGHFRDRGDPIH